MFDLLIKSLNLPGNAVIKPDHITKYLTIYDIDSYLIAYKNYIDKIEKLMKDYQIEYNTDFTIPIKKNKDNRIQLNNRKQYQEIANRLKKEFLEILLTIKYRAKLALTIIDILKTSNDFKSINSDIQFPWHSWTERRHILSYCQSNKIDLLSIFSD